MLLDSLDAMGSKAVHDSSIPLPDREVSHCVRPLLIRDDRLEPTRAFNPGAISRWLPKRTTDDFMEVPCVSHITLCDDGGSNHPQRAIQPLPIPKLAQVLPQQC